MSRSTGGPAGSIHLVAEHLRVRDRRLENPGARRQAPGNEQPLPYPDHAGPGRRFVEWSQKCAAVLRDSAGSTGELGGPACEDFPDAPVCPTAAPGQPADDATSREQLGRRHPVERAYRYGPAEREWPPGEVWRLLPAVR